GPAATRRRRMTRQGVTTRQRPKTRACTHKIAIVRQLLADVRFAPESGQIEDISPCPLCAESGLMHLQQTIPGSRGAALGAPMTPLGNGALSPVTPSAF